MYEAKIILDSINAVGSRLTTFEVTCPRMIHSELMTHRVFSRNASSSRAIPNERLIRKLKEDPVLPVWWGKNQSGMQARQEIEDIKGAKEWWLRGRDMMIEWAEEGATRFNLHKQIVNRPLEAWMWITVIITATEFNNFFHLRCHPDAQPEIREFAEMMEWLYRKGEPQLIEAGDWHLPYVTKEELQSGEYDIPELIRLSTARCARVSHLTHDGVHDPQKDLTLTSGLEENGHWSPFEHQAQARPWEVEDSGNLSGGWLQHRKTFPTENWTGATEFTPDICRCNITDGNCRLHLPGNAGKLMSEPKVSDPVVPHGHHLYPGAPGHNPADPGDCYTSDCKHGCGAWAGPSKSGAPEGIDPWGPCPKAPVPVEGKS